MKKVLSIDWDYFQNASVETIRNCYPDGLDTSSDLSELIWGVHYAEHADKINNVSVISEEFDMLKKLLSQQNSTTPVMIANSHVHIYAFILQHIKENEQISVVNADMHHDITNANPELDCGNWIKQLILHGCLTKQNLKWIHSPVSFEAYGIDTDNDLFLSIKNIDAGTTLSSIQNEKYDLIFIARSDSWSAPHLDGYFNELINTVAGHFTNAVIEQSVNKPRTQYMQYAESVCKALFENKVINERRNLL